MIMKKKLLACLLSIGSFALISHEIKLESYLSHKRISDVAPILIRGKVTGESAF